ncbi:MAG: insulinase family protein [Drouetiella hepatica Uher 2000/2452]|jgi:predicted Zn-dependent peptidase|uniref:Insulinase family protein n=1 Tax=Drouetiella hepatica Uher 2000/2452 TaxID=904376 RepID=A0A951Q8Y3_9CYAN|nr:insulinase family protein [Drouetiella hepatica Uher 2000/2452]
MRYLQQVFCFLLLLIAFLTGAASPSWAFVSGSIQPYIDRVESRISEFTLDNGMKFIVMERHQAPIVSFMTYVNIGSAYEQPGKTGAAHFLEHLAFKGTTRIGTSNYSAEKPWLDRLDALSTQIQPTQGQPAQIQSTQIQSAQGQSPSQASATQQQEFEQAQAKASSYVKQNEFGQIVQQAGGVGLNATTSADATRYFYSFPANKLELWMSLESERFLEPVFREFYEEKNVILEERRMRTDNSPIGKMVEKFLEVALPGNPYGRPVIGSEADIRGLTRQDIQEFYDAHYIPSQIVMAIVGDVNPVEVESMARSYFGRFTARSPVADIQATASTQTAPQEITLKLPTEPWYLEGYQRPALTHPDHAVYEMIGGLLSGGRTSRLYQGLVEKELALNVEAADGFPGDRYPNLMLLYALTAPGHSVEEVAAALEAEITRLKTEPVTVEELDRLKTQSRSGLLQTLASNEGMASLLPEYEAKTGDWHNLFESLKAIEAVTAEDVQRVANDLFQPKNLTIGKLLSDSNSI